MKTNQEIVFAALRRMFKSEAKAVGHDSTEGVIYAEAAKAIDDEIGAEPVPEVPETAEQTIARLKAELAKASGVPAPETAEQTIARLKAELAATAAK